jgi:polar amino acid transport system permease protein
VSFDLSLFDNYWPDLMHGTFLTVELWVAASLIGIAIGFVLALVLSTVMPRHGSGPASFLVGAIRCYVEFFRGTPLLVQLFLVYAGGPHIGITLSAFTVGIWGLGLYGGAYFTEIFRAGFAAIPPGQVEAARSFGFTRAQLVRHVVVPQMLVLIIPPFVNMLIILLKDTAVLSILTIPELTFQVTGMTLETFAFIEPFLALAIVYWVLVEAISAAGRATESWLRHSLGLAT